MRHELKKFNGQRLVFTAIVDRLGKKSGWHGRTEDTILLMDVRFAETQKPATDHIWLTVGKTIDSLELKEGDKIQFTARIGGYVKGYVNYGIDERTEDYQLNRPTKIKKIT